jgi:hypothetical protein
MPASPPTPSINVCSGADDVAACYTAALLDHREALADHVAMLHRLCGPR